MKTFALAILFATLTGGIATAGYNQDYRYSSCANNNSRACRDAREAFAGHHNGQSPEQWNNSWYQGQRGRWNQNGNNWRWSGAEGDQWNQGRQGHWYQEHDGMQFRSDKGDDYRNGRNGWQWSGAGNKHGHDRN
jgi:hypothetical protein